MIILLLLALLLANPLLADDLGQVSGTVKNAHSDSALAGANITLIKANLGAMTDQAGAFLLSKVPTGTDTLVVSFIGYDTTRLPITVLSFRTVVLTIRLKAKAIPLPEVDVTAYREEQRILAVEPSSRQISQKEIKAIPSVAIPDLYRALQKVPGVTFTNELSTGLSVRGGNYDQNLVLLDGAVVYYPFHFLGFASAFNAEMIEEVDFSLGGFSARYGDRLSSVLSVRSRQPQKKFPHRANISLVGADVTSGGKIGKAIGWMVSARTSYFDLINPFLKDKLPYSYYDGLGKMEFQPSPKHRFSIMHFRNRDALNLDDKSRGVLFAPSDSSKARFTMIRRHAVNWTNQVTSAAWEGQLWPQVAFRLQGYYSRSSNYFDRWIFGDFPQDLPEKFWDEKKQYEAEWALENQQDGTAINNRLSDWTAKFSTTWNYRPALQLTFGGQVSRYATHYGWIGDYNFGENVRLFFDHAPPDSFSYQRRFDSKALYAEGSWDVTNRLYLRSGLRLSRWSYLNKGFWEPRLNLHYKLTRNWSFKLAYGRFTQGLSTALEEGLIGFLELYFPVAGGSTIETADHYIASLAYQNSSGFSLSLSAYHKQFEGLIKSIGPEPSFVQTPGSAKGIEMEIKGKLWKIEGWLSYVWSHSERTYNRITYPTNFDQRHRVQSFASFNLGRSWLFSAFWELHSGQPYNPAHYYSIIPIFHIDIPERAYPGDSRSYHSYEVQVPRGRIRYPYYHRLDISLSKSINRRGFALAPYISVRNAYARRNVIYYEDPWWLSGIPEDQLPNYQIRREYFALPIIPTAGLRIGF